MRGGSTSNGGRLDSHPGVPTTRTAQASESCEPEGRWCRLWNVRASDAPLLLLGRIVPTAISSAQWQATRWPPPKSRNGGASVSHRVGCRYGQRVWKRQPEGGFAGEGRSPSSRIRSRVDSTTGSGMGTADINALV